MIIRQLSLALQRSFWESAVEKKLVMQAAKTYMNFLTKGMALIGAAIVLLFTAKNGLTQNVTALPNPTTNSANSLYKSGELSAPTNEFMGLSIFNVKLRTIDSQGLLLLSNLNYLPRIALTNLHENDFAALLENSVGYAALTSFGNSSKRTSESESLEIQMRQIWQSGKSLSDKVQTRLCILNVMKDYNDAATLNTQVEKMAAQIVQATKLEESYRAKAEQENAEAQKWLQAGYNGEYTGHLQKSLAANQQLLQITQFTLKHIDEAQKKLAQAKVFGFTSAYSLGLWGIKVSNAPPFSPIPTLLMRSEVDDERMTNPWAISLRLQNNHADAPSSPQDVRSTVQKSN